MRIAEICPDCATYINASCILYDGEYLSNIDVSPLDSLVTILEKLDTAVEAATGSGEPSNVPAFVGQFYINTAVPALYIGLSDTLVDWGFVAILVTTTTTTTTP